MLQRGRVKRDDSGKIEYRQDKDGNLLRDDKGNLIPVYEPYRIKVFNTIDFAKSMHYNPFAYILKLSIKLDRKYLNRIKQQCSRFYRRELS